MSRREIIAPSVLYFAWDDGGAILPVQPGRWPFLLYPAAGAGARPGVPVWVLPGRPALSAGVEEGSHETSFALPFLCHV